MGKLLVTGQNGFVGKHVQQFMQDGRAQPWQLLPHQPHDLLDPPSLAQWLAPECPDAVLHLAGQSFVPQSFADPAHTLQTNLLGTLQLLQALKARGFSGTFLYVSSGDVYGQVAEADLPITETLPPRPRHPYAVSKLAAEALVLQWGFCEPQWRTLVARPFNHIGPGQAASFVLPSMAQQLQAIRSQRQAPPLLVGDVDVTRDFLDVRDVVRAYFQLLDQGRNGEIYNICSGQERSIRALIEQMSAQLALDVVLATDNARLRRAEQRRAVASPAKLQQHTGWQPQFSMQQTLGDILQAWTTGE